MKILDKFIKKLQTKIYKTQIQAFYLHHKEYLKENLKFYAKYNINISAFRKWVFYGRLIDMLNKTEKQQKNTEL